MKSLVRPFAFSLLLAPLTCAGVASEVLVKGLERPVWAGAPASAKGKLWVMEQAGKVWIIDLKTGQRSKKPFLEITGRVTRKSNEQGLLGLAFAPDFGTSGRYYVNYSEKNGDTRIVRFVSKDGETTDASRGETILKIKQPFSNHNGGWLDFGPDGYLWIATGDGGAANDPKNLAQDLSSHLGKPCGSMYRVREATRFPPTTPSPGKRARCRKSTRSASATRGAAPSTE
jgi:glucose/arabinose dehydrogenase